MKLLIILCSHECNRIHIPNIQIMLDMLRKQDDTIVEYCGISNKNDFSNYESIIPFKYKIVNQNRQMSKICDFITEYKSSLDYDWYIKFRPEIKFLEPINFNILSNNAINARARVYKGPRSIKYGMSVNGEGRWKNIGDCFYDTCEKDIILDDQLFIFHHTVIQLGAFDKLDNLYTNKRQDEWLHSEVWKQRQICFHIIGIHVEFTKANTFSGHIHIPPPGDAT